MPWQHPLLPLPARELRAPATACLQHVAKMHKHTTTHTRHQPTAYCPAHNLKQQQSCAQSNKAAAGAAKEPHATRGKLPKQHQPSHLRAGCVLLQGQRYKRMSRALKCTAGTIAAAELQAACAPQKLAEGVTTEPPCILWRAAPEAATLSHALSGRPPPGLAGALADANLRQVHGLHA